MNEEPGADRPIPASPAMDVPESHWRNVGRVAVHAAWLEEAGALIVYASRGRWDNTYNHLEFARYKGRLFDDLEQIAEALAGVETGRLVPETGLVSYERGVLEETLRRFIIGAHGKLQQRNEIVHSVPWQDWLSSEVEVVHPRSLGDGPSSARGPLPTDEACDQLVQGLAELTAMGQRLAPRVGAVLSSSDTSGNAAESPG